MTEADRKDFAQLITDVLAYYRQDASRFVLDLWWNACKPFALEQVRSAIQKHCTDAERGQFAPKVADLARILQGTTTDRSSLAWGKVLEAMSAVGAYTDVVFDDPAIHAAVEDMGGWPKVCRTDLKELSHLQHRFMQSYRAYAERGHFDYPRRLGGDRSPDSEYEKAGLKLPRPALIGDAARAKLVYQGGGAGKTAISFAPIQSLGSAIAAAIEAPRSAA
jgi:hypothetical protein